MKRLTLYFFVLILLAGSSFGALRFLKEQKQNSRPLVIALSSPETDLSPYHPDLNHLTRTANIYQGLVAFDRNLKIIPALAVSWGNLSPTVWEFKLKRGVTFHDGSFFTGKDVLQSINDAKAKGGAQMEPYTKTIESAEVVEPYTVHIKTKAPDPLILTRLTKIFITPKEGVGSGPYRVAEHKNKESLTLDLFTAYTGSRPAFSRVIHKTIPDPREREVAFKEKTVDILASVPPEFGAKMNADELKSEYGLEVVSLLFKNSDPLLDEAMKQNIQALIDPQVLEDIGHHFVRGSSQFVAPGVFGFNPKIEAFIFNASNKPKDLFKGRLERLNLAYPESFQTLAEYFQRELREAGFSVRLIPLKPDQLTEELKTRSAQLLIVGWQAENGDGGDFLSAFIHSQGEFNGGQFSEPAIDDRIEASQTELSPEKRLPLLQSIFEQVSQKLLGIPLFESSRLYAVQQNINFEPRVDGMVLGAEVGIK